MGASLGALVLAAAVLILVFGGTILNRYGKAKAERAFAEAHPGYALRIGELDYSLGADRLVAQSVTLSGTNMTLKVGRVSLTSVRWSRLLWGTPALGMSSPKLVLTQQILMRNSRRRVTESVARDCERRCRVRN